jgi:hypothetical protein
MDSLSGEFNFDSFLALKDLLNICIIDKQSERQENIIT